MPNSDAGQAAGPIGPIRLGLLLNAMGPSYRLVNGSLAPRFDTVFSTGVRWSTTSPSPPISSARGLGLCSCTLRASIQLTCR